MKKKALIIGITGQDGSYLAELLLDKGYEVHGLRRRISIFNTKRIEHLLKNDNLKLHYGDVTDATGIIHLVSKVRPAEIYNLAAMSHVHISFDQPSYTGQVDAIGTLNVLEAIRIVDTSIRFYQASTSELYGKVQEVPQTENTPFYPRSPYAVAKLYAFWIVKNYREAYGLFAVNGILFNHESPRRGETFVTRKITMAVARIASGKQKKLTLGNLSSQRDWGHAKDYVKGMCLMLQADRAEDFVLATNITTTVRDFTKKAFQAAGITLEFKGENESEIGVVTESKSPFVSIGDVLIEVNLKYFRPTEVDLLIGDPSKARKVLGWRPEIGLEELIDEMITNDIKEVKNEISRN